MAVRELRMGKATRDAYGAALLELGRKNPAVVVVDADLAKSTRTDKFQQEFPGRHFDLGIQEANAVGVASGLASCGKVSFVSSFACFLMCKAFDQMRMNVSYPAANVKLAVTHAGISIGEDGPSQQSVEDLALACSLPGMVVLVPADAPSAHQLVLNMAEHRGPCFIRLGRPNAPLIYEGDLRQSDFPLGGSKLLQDGEDCVVVACGLLVAEALKAADMLREERNLSVAVIDAYTIKPFPEAAVATQARKTGAVVAAEEHLAYGGLGCAVARTLGRLAPVPFEHVHLPDRYAESGTTAQLLEKYGLTAPHLARAAIKAVARKQANPR